MSTSRETTAPSEMPRLAAQEHAGAVLACLPRMTPSRLDALVTSFGGVEPALRAIGHGELDGAAGVPDAVRPLAPHAAAWHRAVVDRGIDRVLARRQTLAYVRGTAAYPIADEIPDRPTVLLAEGTEDGVWTAPRVAVVGTRAASPHGLADAREIGAVLARAGVTVVSGLAIGIDGAAHEGALDAGGRVVGVVATGLDIVYPRRHQTLYARVRRSGLLVGELGYGTGPHPGRFPVRNRIIAGLADVVVVVEATERGGARITAERALDYGRPVLAMPGSRRNPAAAGTNALLADGAHPLLRPDDVLLALGLAARPVAPVAEAHREQSLSREQRAVLRASAGDAATADEIAERGDLSPAATARALRELERARLIHRAHGLWWPQLTG